MFFSVRIFWEFMTQMREKMKRFGVWLLGSGPSPHHIPNPLQGSNRTRQRPHGNELHILRGQFGTGFDPIVEDLDFLFGDGVAAGGHGSGGLIGKGDDLVEAAGLGLARHNPMGADELGKRVRVVDGRHGGEPVVAVAVDALMLEHGERGTP
jgi:hypothetical protein